MEINKLLRKNIQKLQPYSSARNEFSGEAMVYLDANENPFNQPFNRYPDPLQKLLKKKIAAIKGVQREQIFLGNGSDEPIDLIFRAFCNPGIDNIVTINPTYGMYEVAAGINDIEVKKVPLTEKFELDASLIFSATDEKTKIIFLCSPNNPTGNCFDRDEILKIIRSFEGLVLLDEAYIDFAPAKSLLPELNNYSNLIILHTFSKAWGMAGIRLGMAFATSEIISVLTKIKYPYNLNILTQTKAMELLSNKKQLNKWVKIIIGERDKLAILLQQLPFVVEVYPSDANFLLVKMHDANGIHNYLMERGIIVRNRSNVHLCEGSLRITVGSPSENEILIKALNDLI
ncbi:MAG: histidinol-phosphate transaminase [Prolixibacteraceae bacterium]|nr:histidinol-phosphate transaminase [Prolixibacteraceae bacterium]